MFLKSRKKRDYSAFLSRCCVGPNLKHVIRTPHCCCFHHAVNSATFQIEKKKLDFREKASSKVGSLNNVSHKAGGGDKKIFDDKDYLRQMQSSPCKTPTSKASSEANLSRTQVSILPCQLVFMCSVLEFPYHYSLVFLFKTLALCSVFG